MHSQAGDELALSFKSFPAQLELCVTKLARDQLGIRRMIVPRSLRGEEMGMSCLCWAPCNLDRKSLNLRTATTGPTARRPGPSAIIPQLALTNKLRLLIISPTKSKRDYRLVK